MADASRSAARARRQIQIPYDPDREYIGLVRRTPPLLESPYQCILSPDIDLNRLRKWHNECRLHHGESCNNRYTTALAQHLDHLILVDVNARCLVSLPVSTKFVALSYVWGHAATTKLRRDNFDLLQQPGVLLANNEQGIVIPTAIRHAIYLTKRMGERYLWVDCLCIIQDADPAEMNRMLRAMARIYASAEFTIVAAGGETATYGLPGIGKWARSRSASVCRSEFRDRANDFGYPWASVWASRGWTFQESVFSRRLLVFDGAVSWLCGRCTWLEEAEDVFPRLERWPVERLHLGVPMGMISLLPKIPALGRWGMLAEQFSSRSLTYEKDFEAAFAGATEIMGSTFPGGLIHGLPLLFFDIALLWQPKTISTRRAGLPSWSWMGWKGHIECLTYWATYYPRVYRQSDEPGYWIAIGTLKPLAMYKLECTSQSDLGYMNGFYEYQAMRENPYARLPEGWKRCKHPAGAFYTFKDDEEDEIRYPYPLPLANSSPQPAPTIHSPTLTCTAPIATLSLGTVPEHVLDASIVRLPILHHEQRIGVMTIHERINDDDPQWNSGDRACELVAISEAEVSDYYGVLSDGLATRISIYNVLWIEWEDDVAYRKGTGALRKDVWDTLRPEVRTFRLG